MNESFKGQCWSLKLRAWRRYYKIRIKRTSLSPVTDLEPGSRRHGPSEEMNKQGALPPVKRFSQIYVQLHTKTFSSSCPERERCQKRSLFLGVTTQRSSIAEFHLITPGSNGITLVETCRGQTWLSLPQPLQKTVLYQTTRGMQWRLMREAPSQRTWKTTKAKVKHSPNSQTAAVL